MLNALFLSHFSYCPLVWMCHSRSKNDKINRLYESSLRILYRDKNSPFEELLDEDCSVTTHKRYSQFLGIEIFKVAKNSAPTIFYEKFKKID